jgi:TPP-dependent pyruvate/acetoin dehydrogenase alpha subunit
LLITLSSMSDPGTTYRTREEIQQVRSERDAIAGLKKYILEWNVTDEDSLKVGRGSLRVVIFLECADGFAGHRQGRQGGG